MKKQFAFLTAGILLLSLTGCSPSKSAVKASKDSPSAQTSSGLNIAEMFTDRDKEIGYDEEDCTAIILNGDSATCTSDAVSISDSTITISVEGTYILSGSLENGMLIIDAEKTDKIRLILDNADINCDSSAALYVKQADKVFITLAPDSQNTLSNTTEFTAIDENNIDAVIFSKDDLTINGTGSLAVNAVYGHGIVSKDDLVFVGGNYQIDAERHALSANDSIRIADGTFTLSAGTDTLHAENTEDTSLGFIYIAEGSFEVNSGSDGVDASNVLQIDGGSFEISSGDDGILADSSVTVKDGTIHISQSYEGIEGSAINIQGGKISICSDDDGLNAASKSNEMNPFEIDENASISISGGTIYVDARGDGIDSNGNLTISGGEIFVSGPTDSGNSFLDYNGEASITGGVFIASGSNGMVQNFTSSTQGCALVSVSQQAAKSEIVLKADNGNPLISYTPPKEYNCILLSSPDLIEGETYTVTYGSEETAFTLDSLIYGEGSMGGHGGGMGKPEGGMGRPSKDQGQEGIEPPSGERPDKMEPPSGEGL